MANYCTSCGAPAAGAFCVNCGQPIQAPIQPQAQQPPQYAAPQPPQYEAPQPQYPPQYAAAPAAASPGSKTLLIVLGVVALCAVVLVGGIVYVGYRAKQKVTELAQTYGVDTSGNPSRAAVPSGPVAGNGCPLLSGQEAAQILGIAIQSAESTRHEDGSETCKFTIDPAERKRLAGQQMSEVFKKLGSGVAPKNDKEAQSEAERLITGGLNAIEGSSPAGHAPAFTLELVRSGGKEKWASVETAQGGMKGTTGLGMEEIAGLGDKAYITPAGVGAFVLKGDALLGITFDAFGPGRDKVVALARAVRF